jgi:hypothetical protein
MTVAGHLEYATVLSKRACTVGEVQVARVMMWEATGMVNFVEFMFNRQCHVRYGTR